MAKFIKIFSILIRRRSSMISSMLMVLIISSLTVDVLATQKAKRIKLSKADSKEAKDFSTNELLAAYLERGAFRHKVLSENMANVNTPGYKADDVPEAEDFEDLVGDRRNPTNFGLTKTNRFHLEGKRTVSDRRLRKKLHNPYEIKPNGNNVSIAQQMTKLSQNQQDYNAGLKSYATTNALISAVLGKN